MIEVDYLNLLALAVVAVLAPLIVDALRLPIPDVVAQIVCGITVGPSVLGWVEVDAPVEVLSALGLAYLLFVSGLEIRVAALRGRAFTTGVWSFALSAGIAIGLAALFLGTGLVTDMWIIVAALITTSLGIVVVVLKDEGRLATPMGQLTLLGASLGDFASVALLSVLFSGESSSLGLRLTLLSLFAIAVLAITGTALRLSTLARLRDALLKRTGGASQIAVRGSFALMVGFAAMAQSFGLEAILGAFAAGVVLSAVGDHRPSSGDTRAKLEVVGFGLLAPLFFTTSGVRFDLGALTGSSRGLTLVPLMLVAMIACRTLPALLFSKLLSRQETIASGLLMSTKLTFVVAAVTIGQQAGALDPATASALITAAVITVIALPTAASWILRRQPMPAVVDA